MSSAPCILDPSFQKVSTHNKVPAVIPMAMKTGSFRWLISPMTSRIRTIRRETTITVRRALPARKIIIDAAPLHTNPTHNRPLPSATASHSIAQPTSVTRRPSTGRIFPIVLVTSDTDPDLAPSTSHLSRYLHHAIEVRSTPHNATPANQLQWGHPSHDPAIIKYPVPMQKRNTYRIPSRIDLVRGCPRRIERPHNQLMPATRSAPAGGIARSDSCALIDDKDQSKHMYRFRRRWQILARRPKKKHSLRLPRIVRFRWLA